MANWQQYTRNGQATARQETARGLIILSAAIFATAWAFFKAYFYIDALTDGFNIVTGSNLYYVFIGVSILIAVGWESAKIVLLYNSALEYASNGNTLPVAALVLNLFFTVKDMAECFIISNYFAVGEMLLMFLFIVAAIPILEVRILLKNSFNKKTKSNTKKQNQEATKTQKSAAKKADKEQKTRGAKTQKTVQKDNNKVYKIMHHNGDPVEWPLTKIQSYKSIYKNNSEKYNHWLEQERLAKAG